MQRKKVLMLGWEFPPLINGGLGVACYGIVEALSNYVDLTLVLPKSDPNSSLKNVEIIGVNSIDPSSFFEQELQLTQESQQTLINEIKIASSELNPYYQYERESKEVEVVEKTSFDILIQNMLGVENVSPEFLNVFKTSDVYGDDVILKVILFSKYAEKISNDIDFDIIYAHDWMTFLAGIQIKFKTGKPLVLHVHALDYDRVGPDSHGWIFDLEKYAMQNADRIIPVSNYTAGIVRDHYQVNQEKITPIHNGAIPVEKFHEDKKFPEKLVLFLGRVTGQKGPEFFLDIASKVFSEYSKVRFVVAGTGDKLKRLIETGAYRNIGHRFHFTGFLDKEKVNRLLSMTDVYCMPSVSEPFGLSALEAAQFDIPVVLSKQSGVSEVLDGALKADFWDVDLMAEHIIALLSSKKVVKKLTAQNRENLKGLTWSHAADKINNVFNQF